MKPILLVLLFLPLLVFTNSSSANKNNFFKLHEAIKKGDKWMMGIQIDNDLINPPYPFVKIPLPVVISTSHSLSLNTHWKVECIESNIETISLKFTLKRLKVGLEGIDFTNNKIEYFNDTKYPIARNFWMPNVIDSSFYCSWDTESIGSKGIVYKSDFKGDIGGNTMQQNPFNIMCQSNLWHYYSAFAGENIINHIQTCFFDVIRKSNTDNVEKDNFTEKNINTVIHNNPFHFLPNSERDSILEVLKNKDSFKKADSIPKIHIGINTKNNLPIIFKDSLVSLKAWVYDFKKSNNTQISGSFKGSLDEEVTLHIEYPLFYPERKCRLENGEFKFTLNLKEPVFGYIKIAKRKLKLFISPGMDVHIQFDSRTIKGEGANDIICYNECINELKIPNYKVSDKTYLTELRNGMKNCEKVLQSFEGKVSPECKKFTQEDATFKMAYWLLMRMFELKIYDKNTSDSISNAANEIINIVETMIKNGNISYTSPYYHRFITEYLDYTQRNLKKNNRNFSGYHFEERFSFIKMFYEGYPAVYSNYKLFEEGVLTRDLTKAAQILQHFQKECKDEKMVKAMETLYTEMEKLQPGQKVTLDGITDFNGKPIKLPSNQITLLDIRSKSSRKENKNLQFSVKELDEMDYKHMNIDRINYLILFDYESKEKITNIPIADHVNVHHYFLPKDDEITRKRFKAEKHHRLLVLAPDHTIIENKAGSFPENLYPHSLQNMILNYFNSTNNSKSKTDKKWLLLIVCMSFCIFGGLAWGTVQLRTWQIRKQEATRRKVSELELKAIRSQMNPHFMFNALGSIQNLINHNKVKSANKYLSKFAFLMRLVLNNSEKKLVPLSDEINLVTHYLELEQLRFPFNYKVNLEPGLNIEEEELPGMLIQPYIENAVIHGISTLESGIIELNIYKQNKILYIEVLDNGVGINSTVKSRGNGVAMHLINERIKLLNSQPDFDITLKVEDRKEKENTTGTRITISIPV